MDRLTPFQMRAVAGLYLVAKRQGFEPVISLMEGLISSLPDDPNEWEGVMRVAEYLILMMDLKRKHDEFQRGAAGLTQLQEALDAEV
jgi:hypothetical protein